MSQSSRHPSKIPRRPPIILSLLRSITHRAGDSVLAVQSKGAAISTVRTHRECRTWRSIAIKVDGDLTAAGIEWPDVPPVCSRCYHIVDLLAGVRVGQDDDVVAGAGANIVCEFDLAATSWNDSSFGDF